MDNSPLAQRSGFRIKLNLEAVYYSDQFYLFVDPATVRSILDLERKIKFTFSIAENIHLMCNGCNLSSRDAITVLRDEDLVIVFRQPNNGSAFNTNYTGSAHQFVPNRVFVQGMDINGPVNFRVGQAWFRVRSNIHTATTSAQQQQQQQQQQRFNYMGFSVPRRSNFSNEYYRMGAANNVRLVGQPFVNTYRSGPVVSSALSSGPTNSNITFGYVQNNTAPAYNIQSSASSQPLTAHTNSVPTTIAFGSVPCTSVATPAVPRNASLGSNLPMRSVNLPAVVTMRNVAPFYFYYSNSTVPFGNAIYMDPRNNDGNVNTVSTTTVASCIPLAPVNVVNSIVGSSHVFNSNASVSMNLPGDLRARGFVSNFDSSNNTNVVESTTVDDPTVDNVQNTENNDNTFNGGSSVEVSQVENSEGSNSDRISKEEADNRTNERSALNENSRERARVVDDEEVVDSDTSIIDADEHGYDGCNEYVCCDRMEYYSNSNKRSYESEDELPKRQRTDDPITDTDDDDYLVEREEQDDSALTLKKLKSTPASSSNLRTKTDVEETEQRVDKPSDGPNKKKRRRRRRNKKPKNCSSGANQFKSSTSSSLTPMTANANRSHIRFDDNFVRSDTDAEQNSGTSETDDQDGQNGDNFREEIPKTVLDETIRSKSLNAQKSFQEVPSGLRAAKSSKVFNVQKATLYGVGPSQKPFNVQKAILNRKEVLDKSFDVQKTNLYNGEDFTDPFIVQKKRSRGEEVSGKSFDIRKANLIGEKVPNKLANIQKETLRAEEVLKESSTQNLSAICETANGKRDACNSIESPKSACSASRQRSTPIKKLVTDKGKRVYGYSSMNWNAVGESSSGSKLFSSHKQEAKVSADDKKNNNDNFEDSIQYLISLKDFPITPKYSLKFEATTSKQKSVDEQSGSEDSSFVKQSVDKRDRGENDNSLCQADELECSAASASENKAEAEFKMDSKVVAELMVEGSVVKIYEKDQLKMSVDIGDENVCASFSEYTDPRIGDIIIFRILKLNFDVTPGTSNFICGKVIGVSENREITLEILVGKGEFQKTETSHALLEACYESDEDGKTNDDRQNDEIQLSMNELFDPKFVTRVDGE